MDRLLSILSYCNVMWYGGIRSVGVQRRRRIEFGVCSTDEYARRASSGGYVEDGFDGTQHKITLVASGNLERREIGEGRCRLANNRLRWREGVDRNGGSSVLNHT